MASKKNQKTIKSNKSKKIKKKSVNKNNVLNKFVNKKLKNENIIIFNEKNKDKIDYSNQKINNFFLKLVDILNFAFEREREHHIARGSYYPGYKHDINTIKSNVHNHNYDTYILTSKQMNPISMLYVEKNENDFDKVWTVCTHKDYRGKGMSSKLLNYMIVNQLNNNRNDMLLEVYNDYIINRKERDVKQKQIMSLFGSKGFENINPNILSKHSYDNLLSNEGETKIMVFNPKEWLNKNPKQHSKLNQIAQTVVL